MVSDLELRYVDTRIIMCVILVDLNTEASSLSCFPYSSPINTSNPILFFFVVSLELDGLE